MSFQDLVKLMDTLRGEKGCPWDKKQTLDSLKPFLIEETYEVIEAIEQSDPEKLKEELGDLLFHILFISKVSADFGRFGIEDVITFEYEKMRRRHPHVFGPQGGQPGAEGEGRAPPGGSDSTPQDGDEVLKQWYEIKRQERAQKGSRSLMDGIPRSLPALQKAQKVQRRAAQVGFDWEKPEGVLEKVSEEVREMRAAISEGHPDDVSEETGDLLFSMVNLCRFLNVDAEGALRETITKFARRFKAMESQAATTGKTLRDLSLEEMDAQWEAVKAKEEKSSQQKE